MPQIHYESNEHGVVHGFVSDGHRTLRFQVPITGLIGIEILSRTVNALLVELDERLATPIEINPIR